MHGKDFLLDTIRTFFAVVTLCTVAMLVLGLWFFPDKKVVVGYEVFAIPLLYGVVGTLPNFVMYSKRELTVKELMARKVIQLILIEILVLFAVFFDSEAYWDRIDMIISVAVSIFVIYVVTSVIDWFQNYITAKRMMEDLIKFQNR